MQTEEEIMTSVITYESLNQPTIYKSQEDYTPDAKLKTIKLKSSEFDNLKNMK